MTKSGLPIAMKVAAILIASATISGCSPPGGVINDTYSCAGDAEGTDGALYQVNASAEVLDGKISVGATSLDQAVGETVTEWGAVDWTSRTEFTAQMRPYASISDKFVQGFVLTCSSDSYS